MNSWKNFSAYNKCILIALTETRISADINFFCDTPTNVCHLLRTQQQMWNCFVYPWIFPATKAVVNLVLHVWRAYRLFIAIDIELCTIYRQPDAWNHSGTFEESLYAEEPLSKLDWHNSTSTMGDFNFSNTRWPVGYINSEWCTKNKMNLSTWLTPHNFCLWSRSNSFQPDKMT